MLILKPQGQFLNLHHLKMALHPTRRFVEGCLGYHAHSLLQVSKVIQESTYHIAIIRSLTLQIQIKTYKEYYSQKPVYNTHCTSH